MGKSTIEQKLVFKGKWKFEVRDDKTGELLRVTEAENLLPTVGLNAIASQLADPAITKDLGDNLYIAVGSDGTTPASGDTKLGTEAARKAITDRNAAGVVATIAVFFASGEATGTHLEAGLFGDGVTTTCSAAADSGILYSHVNMNETVDASENLTVTWTLTLASA
jgi:hypothetical protein